MVAELAVATLAPRVGATLRKARWRPYLPKGGVSARVNVAPSKYLEYARSSWDTHADTIKKFGRYPHRNACLGRESSQEEKEWLSTGETLVVSQGKD
jgi:hypothetical protein